MAKKEQTFNNDWEALIAKPTVAAKKDFASENEPDPFYQKREDTYYGLFPSDAGERYAFAIVPDAKGNSVFMADVATIQRFRFTSPKDGKHYFEGLKMIMEPKHLFDMSVMDKLKSDPNSLTEDEKTTIRQIKRHGDLIQRYKDLQYCKEEGINFGYSPKPTLFNNRLKKVSLTAFFGIWTKWKGAINTHGDRGVKLITSTHAAFADKFRALLTSTNETHAELQPTWYQDYFSLNGEVKGLIDVKMGSMKVGGEGATVKLIKVGKDSIDDKGAGLTGPILEKDIVLPQGPENVLSHPHFYLGMKSNGSLYHDTYADRFEEALEQLEAHVSDVKLRNMAGGSTSNQNAQSDAVAGGNTADAPF